MANYVLHNFAKQNLLFLLLNLLKLPLVENEMSLKLVSGHLVFFAKNNSEQLFCHSTDSVSFWTLDFLFYRYNMNRFTRYMYLSKCFTVYTYFFKLHAKYTCEISFVTNLNVRIIFCICVLPVRLAYELITTCTPVNFLCLAVFNVHDKNEPHRHST